MGDETDGNRRTRWSGLVRLSLSRVRTQASRHASGLTIPTIVIVALTISNLVLVTGVALALADDQRSTDDADLGIAPGGGDTHSSVSGVEEPRLGDAHERAALIADRDGVTHAMPALAEPVRIAAPEGDRSEYVLVVGVVPGPEETTVAGLSTAGLEPGDAHYAGGAYDGPRAGEIVLSEDAAETLGVSEGDSVSLADANGSAEPRTHAVTSVESASSDDGQPVALVHLSELQALTGADGDDLADRVLVWGDEDEARAGADDAYPNATAESGGDVDPRSVFGDDLALITSVLALLIGVGLCSLFVATAVGLTVDSDRHAIAVLAALGFSTRSRLAIVAVATVATTLVGALFGTVLGFVGIAAVNAVATALFAPGAVALSHPLLAPYALVVALLSVCIALPYPLAIAARTDVLEEIER